MPFRTSLSPEGSRTGDFKKDDKESAMDLFLTIIAVLMVTDAAFALLNITEFESILQSQFPKMNVKKLAVVEGAVGVIILLLKIATGSVF